MTKKLFSSTQPLTYLKYDHAFAKMSYYKKVNQCKKMSIIKFKGWQLL